MVHTIIKITCGGCGIKYKDANGVERHALKTPEDGPFECEIEQAKRLVALGVAEYMSGSQCQGDIEQGDTEQGDTGEGAAKITGRLDAAELEKWDYKDLKALAADMGVEPEGKKKSDYIAAIVAANVEIDDEGEGEGDDELPELNAADPE